MKKKQTTIYKCDFCGKWYQRKHLCQNHEIKCFRNPENDRVCFHCHFIEMKSETLYFDTPIGEGKKNVDALFCNKLNVWVYPPKVDHKGNEPYEFGDIENIPMKKECEHYNTTNIFDDL